MLLRPALDAFVGLALVATVCFGGSFLLIPAFLGAFFFGLAVARLSSTIRAIDPLPMLSLLALAAAPWLAAEVVDVALARRNLVAPGASWLAAAVAGWIVLPLLPAPTHACVDDDAIGVERWMRAIGRALAGADERRRRMPPLMLDLAGLALGALLVAPREILVRVAETAWSDTWGLVPIVFGAAPALVLVPIASAILAVQDDALLADPAGGAARSPLWLTTPLVAGIGLTLVALLHVPTRAHERHIGATLDGWSTSDAAVGEVTVTQLRGAFVVDSPRGSEHVLGPHGAWTMGLRRGDDTIWMAFAVPGGARLVSAVHRNGERLDDSLPLRIATRWTPVAWALLGALALGALLLMALRPGRLHRLTRPSRRLTSGTLQLEPGASLRRDGHRTFLEGHAVFCGDDGSTVLSLDESAFLLGVPGGSNASVRVTLASPSAAASLSLRTGASPLPAGSVLLGPAGPVDTLLSTAMQRSAVAPVVAMSALAAGLSLALLLAL